MAHHDIDDFERDISNLVTVAGILLTNGSKTALATAKAVTKSAAFLAPPYQRYRNDPEAHERADAVERAALLRLLGGR